MQQFFFKLSRKSILVENKLAFPGKIYKIAIILYPLWKSATSCGIEILILILLNNQILNPLRIKGRINLRNGMWYGLRNDIFMRNVVYAQWLKNKLSWKLRTSLAPINSQALTFLLRADYDVHTHEDSTCLCKSGCVTAPILSRKSVIEEKMFWMIPLPSFSAKDICVINFAFYLYLHLKPR